MIRFRFLFFFLLLFTCLAGFSQGLEFTENKGQWDSQVKLRTEMSNGALFLEAQGYLVAQHNDADLVRITSQLHGITNSTTTTSAKGVKPGDDGDNMILHSHAYRVQFANSNPAPEIIREKPQPGISNYFKGADRTKWGVDCKMYGAALYKNVYPGIDVRYYGDNGRLKYDILVQPNADISKLALDYIGVDGLEIKNGDLYVKTSVATTKELYPYSYQIINGQRRQIGSKYKLYNHTVRFDLDQYDRSAPLVIDPSTIFTTFTGSRADNWGYTATYGPGGVGYAGGIVMATGYPVSIGAYQSNFAGGVNTGEGNNGFDIGIIKLSADGTQRLYATYVGGSGNEAPHSMIVDAQGNLVVAGRTNSSNFPGTKIGPGGSYDIIVFKLSATGNALIGSLILGGESADGVNIRNKYPSPARESLMQYYGDDSRSEVIIDGAGNILLASCTQGADFPVTKATAAQPNKSGGQDALFLKFTPNLSALTYGTFFGGTGNDAAYVLGVSPETGNVYMAGGTESNNIPGDKTGTIGPNLHGSLGDIDGFVTEFGTAGNIIRSTYIGTGGIDQVYGLKFDRYGFPYIMGTTLGSMPVINAAFSQAGGKQFISKLQKDLSSYVYSTNFGTNSTVPNISPIAFLVDRCQNVYVSGWGGPVPTPASFLVAGTLGMSITPGAIKSNTDGQDFYFFVLQRDATAQLYGSFFGQNGGYPDHVDGGTSRFDENGVIYQGVCANCGREVPFPTSPGAWSSTNQSAVCNEALTKIAFDLAGVNSGVKSSIRSLDGDTSDCVPTTVRFRDTVAIAQSYEWNFGDGSASVTTKTAEISHIYTQIGTYRVRLIAVDSNKCFPRDTTFTTIRVREDYANVRGNAAKLPPCTSTNYQFNNISTLSAPASGKPFKASSFRWIWGDGTADLISGTQSVTHLYPGYGTYNAKLVLEDTNYCNAPDTFPISVRIAPNVRASTNTPLSGCAPYNAVFTNTSLGGTDFFWDFDDGTTSTEISPVHLFTIPRTYRVRLIANDTTTCNKIDTAYYNIIVSGAPTAAFTYTPNPPLENTISVFTNRSQGAIRYRWYYGDGDTLYTYRLDTTVRHIYNETKRYVPCLVAINQYNCPDTACQNLDAIINPLLDVPNAFTPNGDGANDRAVVIGYGISKMTFRIYNRWGQLMFETNDRKLGWDGRFNGKAQPMDVYAYTLEAEFFDGKRTRKQGDITLLR